MKSAAVALVAAATAVVPVPDLARAAPAEAECTYTDPDFVMHTHALDIDEVRVARSQNGLLTFTVGFPKDLELASDTGFQIAVDADSDRATGDEQGFDRFFGYVQDAPEPNPWLSKWRDGRWTKVPTPSLEFSHDRDRMAFRLDAGELSDAFSFQVAAGTRYGSDDGDVDFAPEREHVVVASERGVWTFPACETIGAEAADSGGGWMLPVVLGAFGLGAVLAVAGWTVEKIRARRA